MPNDSSVVADPAAGIAIVAGRRIAMQADAATGTVRFGGATGSMLRPLAFGERTELVSESAALAFARDAVAAAVLHAATVERGSGETTLLEVLALWLAGAAWDAPDFNETTLLVARGAGWPPHDLFSAQAREVDRLAVHLDEARQASEWKTIVFAEAPAESVEEVRAQFADRLLRRVHSSVVAAPAFSRPQRPLPAGEALLDDASVAEAATAPLERSESLAAGRRAESPSVVGWTKGWTTGRTTDTVRSAAMVASRAVGSVDPAESEPSFPGNGLSVARQNEERSPVTPASGRPERTLPAGTSLSGRMLANRQTGSERHSMAPTIAEVAAVPREPGQSLATGRRVESLSLHGTTMENGPSFPWSGGLSGPRPTVVTPATSRPERSLSAVTSSAGRMPLDWQAGSLRSNDTNEPDDLAQLLASLLDDEADLRGVDR